MARIFDNNASNFLDLAATIASERVPFTVGQWVKRTAGGGTYQVTFDLTSSGSFVSYDEGASDPDSFERFYPTGGTPVPATPAAYTYDVWQLLVAVVDSTEAWLYIDGALAGQKDTETYTGLNPTTTQMILGKDAAGTAPFYGKIAHPFIFKRALSSGEIASLVTAAPTTLSSTGQAFYAPLITSDLTNLWTPGGGDSFGTLAVTGTVAWDTDSPYASGSALLKIMQMSSLSPLDKQIYQAGMAAAVGAVAVKEIKNRRHFLAAAGAAVLTGVVK